MTTDNGNGMKVVTAVILFSLFLFFGGLAIGWIGNNFIHPSWSSTSVAPSSTR